MGTRAPGITWILVGVKQVGIAGLNNALSLADESSASDRCELVDLMMAELAEYNYISSSAREEYRKAIWREYRRHRGEDIRDLYSEIEVVVRGLPGPELDQFLNTVVEVFAKFELLPVTALEPSDPDEQNPQLLIQNDVVAAGVVDFDQLARAVSRRLSDW